MDMNLTEWEDDARSELSDYEPFDQKAWLGESPWTLSDPAVIAWEAEHGHDPRLKCYPEFGCQLIEVVGARRILSLIEALRHQSGTKDKDVDLVLVEETVRVVERFSIPLHAAQLLTRNYIPAMVAELRRRRGVNANEADLIKKGIS